MASLLSMPPLTPVPTAVACVSRANGAVSILIRCALPPVSLFNIGKKYVRRLNNNSALTGCVAFDVVSVAHGEQQQID